jgi:cytoskeletal protein CcmA (bactofilin family)
MFSKSKITEPTPSTDRTKPDTAPAPSTGRDSASAAPAYPAKPKPSPSLLSNDLTIKGNVITSGDIQIEGTIEGDVRAHLLTVGESATIKGEICADDVVVNGHVVGRLRGLKVRLTATARVEGDIVHKTIAIESGAHFEGSVQRNEDPLGDSRSQAAAAPRPVSSEARDAPPLTGDTAKSDAKAGASGAGSSAPNSAKTG